jgi:long-chain acyl-CoA synthetase
MAVGLREIAEAKGDELAIVDEFTELTWAELDGRVNRLVHALRDAGLEKGDVIALLGNNRHEWPEVLSAGSVSSWVTVPVNWHFSADEVAYVLENSGAKALIADAEFAETAVAAAEQTGIEIRIMFGGSAEGFADYEELLASASDAEPADPGAGSTMFYTSGTTGRPKGVKSALIEIGGDPEIARFTLKAFIDLLGIPEGGTVLCNAPVYHAGPLVFCLVPAAFGSTLIMRRKWVLKINSFKITNSNFSILYILINTSANKFN